MNGTIHISLCNACSAIFLKDRCSSTRGSGGPAYQNAQYSSCYFSDNSPGKTAVGNSFYCFFNAGRRFLGSLFSLRCCCVFVYVNKFALKYFICTLPVNNLIINFRNLGGSDYGVLFGRRQYIHL